ncbi:Uncharacterised protein [Serratia fonticola]|nr:Uncharacterised protein [Serratia fonticola]
MNITYRWTERLSDLCCKDWEHCYGSENVLTSYALQRALERSKLADSFHYLSLYCDGHLVALSVVSHNATRSPIWLRLGYKMGSRQYANSIPICFALDFSSWVARLQLAPICWGLPWLRTNPVILSLSRLWREKSTEKRLK